MFKFHRDVLTHSEYSFVNGKSVNSREARKAYPQKGNIFAKFENPQTWKLFGRKSCAIYFAQRPGLILPSYILESLGRDGHKVDGCFIYAEALGHQLILVIYNEKRELLFDWIFDFKLGDVATVAFEIQHAIRLITGNKAKLFIHNGIETLGSDQYLSVARDGSDSLYLTTRNEFLKSSLKLTEDGIQINGSLYPWFIATESSSDEAEDNAPILTLSCKVIAIGYGSALTAESLLSKDKSPVGRRLIPLTTIKKQRLLVTSAYFGCVVGIIAAFQLIQYQTLQKRIAEEEALKRTQLIEKDPYRKFRAELTNGNKNLQAEFGLKAVSRVLEIMTRANTPNSGNKPLGWEVAEMVVTGPVITVTPYSMGGSYTDLKKFVDNRRSIFNLRFNERGANIDSMIPPSAITDKPYFTSAEGETAYIADAVNFLFDDVKVTTENRTVNGEDVGQYRIHLVKMEFVCWLSEDFEYLATQFAYRHYSLHSIKIKNESLTRFDKDGQVIEGNKCDFGFSGDLYLQVFGK